MGCSMSSKVGFWLEIKNDKVNRLETFELSVLNKQEFRYLSNDTTDLCDLTNDQYEKFCKMHKGVGIREGSDMIEVFNDPFCSIPVYVMKRSNEYIVTSEFSVFYSYGLEIDKVGIQETILYSSCLNERTIFHGVMQLPAATKLVIYKNTNEMKIVPYWNFEIAENSDIEFSAAVDKVKECLTGIFDEYKEEKIIMGLSGGLDSRLSACLLSTCSLNKKQVEFFTFGYSPKILEYSYACNIARRLGFEKPKFCQLLSEDYERNYHIARETGAAIAPNHCHIYAILPRLENRDEKLLLSNYYSDAVMGWDTIPNRTKETMEESGYFRRLEHAPIYIDEVIKNEIRKDLEKLCSRYPRENGNFSCMDEFIYVTERNPKFHVRMSATYTEYMKVKLPYADYKLLELMLSMPIAFRTEKRIEQRIIDKYYFKEKDVSSRRYSERGDSTEKAYSLGERIYYHTNYYHMRGLNLVNTILARYSNSRVQLTNKYLTENQNIVLNRYLYPSYVKALDLLKDKQIIDKMDYERLKSKEYRSGNTSLKYTIIGVSQCLQ